MTTDRSTMTDPTIDPATLDRLDALLAVDHTETDLEARARVLVRHLTGVEWDAMDPGLRSQIGTDVVRAPHFADEIDPARQRLALVLEALPALLAAARESAAEVAAAKAEAWAHGYDDGRHDGCYDPPGTPDRDNPYRADALAARQEPRA